MLAQFTVWAAGVSETYQASDEAEHAVEQEAHGGQDLEQRLCEEAPEWVELLLGVRHAVNLLLGVVDARGDGAGELWLLAYASQSCDGYLPPSTPRRDEPPPA